MNLPIGQNIWTWVWLSVTILVLTLVIILAKNKAPHKHTPRTFGAVLSRYLFIERQRRVSKLAEVRCAPADRDALLRTTRLHA